MQKIELETPTLILLAGISASGKTHFAAALMKHLYDALIINKDTINNAFLSTRDETDTGIWAYRFSGSPRTIQDIHYHQHLKFQSYHCILELAKDNLEAGRHPIVDGNYTKEIHAGYVEQIVIPFFEGTPHKMKIIHCSADEETIKQRMRRRGASRDADKLDSEEVWKTFLQQQPIIPPELERYSHLKIDTTNTAEQNVDRVLEYLLA